MNVRTHGPVSHPDRYTSFRGDRMDKTPGNAIRTGAFDHLAVGARTQEPFAHVTPMRIVGGLFDPGTGDEDEVTLLILAPYFQHFGLTGRDDCVFGDESPHNVPSLP